MPARPLLIALRRLQAPFVLAALGVCGGSVFPLSAEPPHSSAVAPGDPGITVRAQRPVTIGGTPSGNSCGKAVGQPATQADCGAKALQDAASAAQARAKAGPGLAVPNARSGDTKVGVGSLTGASQRLGADLRGRTTLPVRPAPPPPANPLPR